MIEYEGTRICSLIHLLRKEPIIVICQFSFKNFMSYKDETIFDFQAAAIPELANTLIIQDKASDLLSTSVVYGPNGGGKTNLLKAFACLVSTVVKPVADLGKARESIIFQLDVACVPFLPRPCS